MSAFEDNPMGIDFNFENPVELEEEKVIETTGISMGEEDPLEEIEGTGYTLNFEGETEESEEDPVEDKVIEEPVKETVEPQKSTDDDLGDLSALSEVAPTLANLLYERGHITELPEDVDPEKFSLEDFWKTVDHNIKKKEETGFVKGVKYEQSRIVSKLPDVAKDILAYSLGDNLEDQDVISYMESLLKSKSIKDLSPENVVDAEKIVSEYYKASGWNSEEIKEKVNTLLEGDLLKKEAALLKPKLDAQAEAIARSKVEEQQKLAEMDRQMQENLETRVRSILDTGKLNDIELTRDELIFLYNAAVNNEVPVTVKGGKTVEMGLAEYIVRKHKYDTQGGNLENLLLGLLVIEQGYEAIEKFIGKKARSQEASNFVREFKFSNAKKKGGTTPNDKTKSGGFILNIK